LVRANALEFGKTTRRRTMGRMKRTNSQAKLSKCTQVTV